MDISLTLIIAALTVGLSLYAWNRPAVFKRWLLNPYRIAQQRQYDRLLLSGFIHNDLGHLAFNMLTFFFFGRVVEYTFGALFGGVGWALFLLLYLGSIVVADLPTFFKYRTEPYYNSLGASGGVAAVVFSSIMFDPLNPIYLFFIPIGIPGFILGLLYLLYSAYKTRAPGSDNVNHDAHLYGAVFGVIFTVLLVPQTVPNFVEQISNWRLF